MRSDIGTSLAEYTSASSTPLVGETFLLDCNLKVAEILKKCEYNARLKLHQDIGHLSI